METVENKDGEKLCHCFACCMSLNKYFFKELEIFHGFVDNPNSMAANAGCPSFHAGTVGTT